MPPTFGNGKICYVEIPAIDTAASAVFYRNAFGWTIRQSSDGHTSFDDGVGEVSGTWRTDRPPTAVPGLLVHVMVDDIRATIEKVLDHGGSVAEPITGHGTEWYACIRDPAGNVIGLHQQ